MFSGLNISSSGMTAQRIRTDIIANNLANADTTRTAEGEPYRRKIPLFLQISAGIGGVPFQSNDASSHKGGVLVSGIREDNTPFRLSYDPSHPDADQEGYVELPNVNVVMEMTDLISASRSYEANVTAFETSKAMTMRALEIGR